MGLFIVPKGKSVESNLIASRANIKLFLRENTGDIDYKYLLETFALPLLDDAIAGLAEESDKKMKEGEE